MANEFRQDPVSGDWVLISPGRSKRPGAQEKKDFYQNKENCPFEDPQKSDNKDPLLVYSHGAKIDWTGGLRDEWTTQVVKNKFPAIQDGLCRPSYETGLFRIADGFGFHELVITRDHEKSFAQFTENETLEVLNVYKDRYEHIANESCGEYILIFHNHGRLGGASIYHNHSQILSMPFIPPGIIRSLDGAKNYFDKTGKMVYDILIEEEAHQGNRIVYENESFIAFCPFASRSPYEVRIFPKKAEPDFRNINPEEMPFLAEALNRVLRKLFLGLDDIDYSLFIHTVPPKTQPEGLYNSYRWHIEIMPRSSIVAGVELATNIFINPIDPDDAAKLLREANV